MNDKDVTNKRKQTGETVSQTHTGETRPKLPHEQDQTDSSQESEPREVIKQAYKDVQSGQEDTDLRGSRGKREDSVPKNEPEGS